MNDFGTRRSSSILPHPASAPVVLMLGLAVAAMFYSAVVGAYDRYSVNRDATNCRACHGDFRGTAPYTSASDGVAWKNPSTSANMNLHDGHRTYMLSGDCSACHLASRFPTMINQSNGGTGLPAIGCLGCHGRAEPGAGGAITGAGLRQHHWRAGETSCGNAGCHTDADPASFTTANEHTFPPYYGAPDAAHPNKPTNPCNLNGTESAIAPPFGLDNDGNSVYDGNEPVCDLTPTRSSTWGKIKTLYR